MPLPACQLQNPWQAVKQRLGPCQPCPYSGNPQSAVGELVRAGYSVSPTGGASAVAGVLTCTGLTQVAPCSRPAAVGVASVGSDIVSSISISPIFRFLFSAIRVFACPVTLHGLTSPQWSGSFIGGSNSSDWLIAASLGHVTFSAAWLTGQEGGGVS